MTALCHTPGLLDSLSCLSLWYEPPVPVDPGGLQPQAHEAVTGFYRGQARRVACATVLSAHYSILYVCSSSLMDSGDLVVSLSSFFLFEITKFYDRFPLIAQASFELVTASASPALLACPSVID